VRRLLRKRGEKGANLVEFAILAPFLILLLFGIIEFAWVFATNLDVKHGAREGARITAVNTPDTGNVDLAAEICSRMSIVGSDTATTITWASDGTPAVGEGVTVTVSTPLSTLTGIMDWAFGSVPTLDSTVEMRIEQPPDWSDGTQNCV
jgi:Flp pilus assembly protein TadG